MCPALALAFVYPGFVTSTHCQVYTNFQFMEPLITRMVQDEPTKRPTMDEVTAEFATIRATLSCWKLRERLIERRDSVLMNVLKDVHYLSTRAVPNLLSLRKAVPTPQP